MLLPVPDQFGIHLRRKRDIPILATFTITYGDAGRFDVIDSKVYELVEPEPTAVHKPNRCLVPAKCNIGDDRTGFPDREHNRQSLLVTHYRHIPKISLLAQHVRVEHRKTGDRLPGCGRSPTFHLLEMDDVGTDLLLRKILRVLAIVFGNQPDFAIIRLSGSQRLVLEAKVLSKSL